MYELVNINGLMPKPYLKATTEIIEIGIGSNNNIDHAYAYATAGLTSVYSVQSISIFFRLQHRYSGQLPNR